MTLPQFGTPHVRCFDLDTAARLECLSPDERARADRFHFARDARRWAAGRALLRCTLSAYLSAAPEKLCFALGPWGKPFLPDCPLRFSVTHSDSALLVAIAWQQEVGIDIEGRRPGSTPEQLAPQVLSASENDWLLSHAPGQRPAAFLTLWTAKEAWVKATGQGLSFPLTELTLLPGMDTDTFQSPSTHSVRRLTVGSDHFAALAVEGTLDGIQCFP